MDKTNSIFTFRTLMALLVTGLGCVACMTDTNKEKPTQKPSNPDKPADEDFLYQYSFIDVFLAGVYDGNLTIGELKARGDFGVGGFNGLDGELYMNEREVYKIRYDRSVHKIPDEDKTPIAFVKHFKADTVVTLAQKGFTYEQFKVQLLRLLHENKIYAIRISGKFPEMQTRAPAPADKPYLPLAEHLKKHQYEFELKDTRGTGVGFYLPIYMNKLNIPGFHFHYLSDDKSSGGHVLDFAADSLQVEIDEASGVIMETMSSENFDRANLQKDRENELKEVE